MHAGRFTPLPENQSALQAIERLAKGLNTTLLTLHGPPGSGKSHLANFLVEQFTQADTVRTAQIHSAAELGRNLVMPPVQRRPFAKEAIACDLLVVEDLQHLPSDACDELAYIFDRRLARNRPALVTSVGGPAELEITSRLRSRLAGGLVVGIPPLSASSRSLLAREWCRQKRLKVDEEVIVWLARDPGGARPILGSITLLEVLAKRFPPPLSMRIVEEQIGSREREQSPLDTLVAEVAVRFRVTVKSLIGSTRVRTVVWPRQIAMSIARSAGYSLPEIGAYFGGRDHTTVMHACEKVVKAIASDAALASEIRELQARTSLSRLNS